MIKNLIKIEFDILDDIHFLVVDVYAVGFFVEALVKPVVPDAVPLAEAFNPEIVFTEGFVVIPANFFVAEVEGSSFT